MTETASSAPRNGVVVPQNNGKQTYAELHQIADHFIGGNKLENAKDSKVKDFVAANDGHTVITNVSGIPVPKRSAGQRRLWLQTDTPELHLADV